LGSIGSIDGVLSKIILLREVRKGEHEPTRERPLTAASTLADQRLALDSFEDRARAFLDSRLPPRPPELITWGAGSEGLAIFHETSGAEEVAEVEAAKAWQAERWDAGFGWLTGPVEHGGGGFPPAIERIYRAVEAEYDVPDMMPLRVGLGTVSPGLVACGSPEQIARYAAPLHAGRSVACQLFSEPDAGSDLANVRSRGMRDGAAWTITGQKVWSSNAHLADIGLLLVRTDPDGPKHASLTMFLLPMDSPGVVVRPLRQLTGGSSFTEVFLDDVIVPDDLRVGAIGKGWSVATTTLAAERTSVGDRSHGLMARALTLLRMLAARGESGPGPLERAALTDAELRLRVARFHQQRMQSVPADRLTGGERVLDKLMLTENMRRMGNTAAHLLGPRILADTGEWGTYAWSRWLLGATGMKIGGGTDEILKSMVAERVLGLPREPRP
jgi:alkylation response protein AidB-like acyl-CoA dehydrogenase